MAVKWFAQIAGITLEQVPYRGGGQAINDLRHQQFGAVGVSFARPIALGELLDAEGAKDMETWLADKGLRRRQDRGAPRREWSDDMKSRFLAGGFAVLLTLAGELSLSR